MNWAESTDVFVDEYGEVVCVENAAADAREEGDGALGRVRRVT